MVLGWVTGCKTVTTIKTVNEAYAYLHMFANMFQNLNKHLLLLIYVFPPLPIDKLYCTTNKHYGLAVLTGQSEG